MPWSESLLPPLGGTARAVSVGYREFVAWTEHGLLRYEVETYPALRLLYPPAKAEEKLDRATGRVSWCGQVYRLVGDPRLVGRPPGDLTDATGADGQTLEVDSRRRRVRVLGPGGEDRLTVEGFPPAGAAWSVATFTTFGDTLFLAHLGGVRLFRYTAPPRQQ